MPVGVVAKRLPPRNWRRMEEFTAPTIKRAPTNTTGISSANRRSRTQRSAERFALALLVAHDPMQRVMIAAGLPRARFAPLYRRALMLNRFAPAFLALLIASSVSAQMGHSVDITRDTARAAGAFSGDGDLRFTYDKLIDSTMIVGAILSDAHSGSNFLLTAVSGHSFRPTVMVYPVIRIEGKAHQPATVPDSVALIVTAMLAGGTAHATSRMDAKAPGEGELILLLDDSVRTRVPLKLLDTDSYVSYYGGDAQGTGMTSYIAVVPYSFVVRWSAASKVEGRMPSGDFSFHGRDAHRWISFTDYVSGKAPAPGIAH
jgi:hypothetical protein